MPKSISYLFAVIGTGSLIIGLISMNNTSDFRAEATQAQGEVLRLIPRSTDNGTTYAPEVRFTTVDGTEIVFVSGYSSNPPSYAAGDTVSILYRPEDPYRAQLADTTASYMGSVVLMIFAVLFSGFGFIPLFYSAGKKRKASALKASGQAIIGHVAEVEYRNTLQVNGKSPYRLIAEGIEPGTEQKRVYYSENIWLDPRPHLTEKQSIKIYIDPQKSSRYYVDISFLQLNS